MALNVLLADHDLDVHKLVADLLPILFKNVTIDRAMKSENVMEKLADPDAAYNLIILDLAVDDADGRKTLAELTERFPHLTDRLMLILDAADTLDDAEQYMNFPRIQKPFSLDEFGETVKKVLAQ